MNPLSVLANGIQIFDDDFYRGVACMAGLIPTHEIPVTDTNRDQMLAAIIGSGGFGFATTRIVKPGLFSLQRGIDGVTHSPMGHGLMLIGNDIGKAARLKQPGLLIPGPALGYENPPIGYPAPKRVIPLVPSQFETVEAKAEGVVVTDLKQSLNPGTQTIVFTNPNWTRDQKIAMACEAYRWVGVPYDDFEIAHWVMPLVPNPARLKTCATAVLKFISAGDNGIIDWCRLHGLNPEQIAPGHLFAYAVDQKDVPYCDGCTFTDAVVASMKG